MINFVEIFNEKTEMKRYLLSMAILLGAVCAFVSCSKDDEDDYIDFNNLHAKYQFVEPCLEWNCDKSGVREYMSKMSGWKETNYGLGDPESQESLYFINTDIDASITYLFYNKKLWYLYITYYENEDFDKLKSDLATRYNFEWREPIIDGTVYYNAQIKEYNCQVSLTKRSSFYRNTGIQINQMIAEFTEIMY